MIASVAPAVFAAAEAPPFLVEVAALVVAGALVAYLGHRVGVVPIVGFLLAGVAIGPNALGLVEDREMVDAAAEVGVILLLFTIGLEFSLERLARIRRLILVGGGLQVVGAVAAVGAILLVAGVDWRAAVFTGMLVSLSSTVIVLKVLGDRGELNAPTGQVALGLLLFQDLAIVGMALLVPALGGEGTSLADLGVALLTAAILIAGVIVVARRLMPPLLELVARTCSPEVFLLAVMAICFGTAYGTSLAGLSVSLGAFLAGLLVSESRFDQQALGEVMPLQIVFSAVFFVSVGMLLDLGFMLENLPAVLGAVAALLLVKVVTTGLAARALGYATPVAGASALALAQVGEFSFVLERLGRESGLSPAGLGEAGSQGLIAATVLLMVATPGLAGLGARLGRRAAEPRDETAGEGTEPEPESGIADDLDGHVIVAGYGARARELTAALRSEGVPHVVVTLSPDGAGEAHGRGSAVLLGDATRTRTLLEAGLTRARALLIPDDEPATAGRIASIARNVNPETHVVALTRYRSDVEALRTAGAEKILSEEVEATAALLQKVLGAYDVPGERVEERLRELRTPIRSDTDGLPAPARPRRGGRTRVDTEHAVDPLLDPDACPHAGHAHPVVPTAPGCEECLRSGDSWVHLRTCLACGHVGCCDSSPNRHARRHYEGAGHPLARSVEPGEEWSYCFADELMIEPAAGREPVG